MDHLLDKLKKLPVKDPNELLPDSLDEDLFNALLGDLRKVKDWGTKPDDSPDGGSALPLAYLVVVMRTLLQDSNFEMKIEDIINILNRTWIIFELANLAKKNIIEDFGTTLAMIAEGTGFNDKESIVKSNVNVHDLDEATLEFLVMMIDPTSV